MFGQGNNLWIFSGSDAVVISSSYSVLVNLIPTVRIFIPLFSSLCAIFFISEHFVILLLLQDPSVSKTRAFAEMFCRGIPLNISFGICNAKLVAPFPEQQ